MCNSPFTVYSEIYFSIKGADSPLIGCLSSTSGPKTLARTKSAYYICYRSDEITTKKLSPVKIRNVPLKKTFKP